MDFAPILAALLHDGRKRSVWLFSKGERLMVDLDADGSILVWRLGADEIPAGLVGSAKVGRAGLEEDHGGALQPLEAELHAVLSDLLGLATAPALPVAPALAEAA